jgi:hypothetical protein
MNVSSRVLTMLADTLRQHRDERATRWRKLTAARQALLVVAMGLSNERTVQLGLSDSGAGTAGQRDRRT